MPPKAKSSPAATPLQTEAEQVAAAPVVEQPTPDTPDAPSTTSTDEELKARVTAIMAEQFGGEDGAPAEGVTPWNDMVRQMVIEADQLETAYQQILKKKEANRTLLRAFRDMGQLPGDVCEFYYTTRKRKTKAEKAAEKANGA